MLRHLRVTNFAILSDVALDFGEGLNALTGETGAGKSLIVDAVNLLRGGRASADIPRSGAEEAVVEAIYEVPDDLVDKVAAVLDAAGLPNDGSYHWRVEPHVPQQVYLRLEVRDKAGNVGVHQLREPINVSGLRPKAHIRGILPIDNTPRGALLPQLYR